MEFCILTISCMLLQNVRMSTFGQRLPAGVAISEFCDKRPRVSMQWVDGNTVNDHQDQLLGCSELNGRASVLFRNLSHIGYDCARSVQCKCVDQLSRPHFVDRELQVVFKDRCTSKSKIATALSAASQDSIEVCIQRYVMLVCPYCHLLRRRQQGSITNDKRADAGLDPCSK